MDKATQASVALGNDRMPVESSDAPRAFPLPGSRMYDFVCNPEFKKQFHPKLKMTNRFVIPLYRAGVLPLIGLGKSIMLLTTKGRKSGKRRSFPVGYFRIDGGTYVFSAWGEKANWYKNLVQNPEELYVQMGFRRYHAHAQVIRNPAELKSILARFVLESPRDANTMMGWDASRDDPETSDFSMMMEKVLIVRIDEC